MAARKQPPPVSEERRAQLRAEFEAMVRAAGTLDVTVLASNERYPPLETIDSLDEMIEERAAQNPDFPKLVEAAEKRRAAVRRPVRVRRNK